MSGRPAAVCFWNSLRRSLTNSEKTRNSANGARRVHSPVACGRDHGTAPTPGQQTGPVQILRMDQPDMVTPVWPTTVHSLSKSRLRHESTAGFGVGIVARRPEPPKTSVTRQARPSHRSAHRAVPVQSRRYLLASHLHETLLFVSLHPPISIPYRHLPPAVAVSPRLWPGW